jgi:acyl transferase domain-containing protein
MSVEIIGRAVIAPGANSPSELFSILRQGKCVVTEVPDDRWDKARYWHPKDGVRGKTYSFAAGIVEDCFRFDPAAFNMSTREAQLLDPQQRLLLQTTLRALEDANLDPSDLRSQRVGVYVGASGLDHGNLIVEDPAAAGPYFMTGNTLSIVSNRVSHIFGLNGPSLTVDTACSSSLVALDLAMKALEAGEVDVAIVGGVNVLTHPLAFVGFAQAHMLSPEGLCRAYDENGQGYVRAEGASTVVLRRTDVAKANGDRSHARILVTRVNSAGRTNGISLPSREAQAQLLGSIYGEGRIDPNSLAFVEGHGTGTRVGDPAEIWSIGTVIGSARRAPLPLGSIKTNIGHAEPASGLMGLMKAMLSLEHNVFPASLHFETPNRSVDFRALNVHVAADAIELLHGKHPRLAGINSFGFGGTNAHVVISDPEAPPAMAPEDMPQRQIFTASAHTEGALARLLADYRTQLRTARASQRKSIISASGANRAQMRHRFVMANCDAASLDTAIETFLSTKETPAAVVSQALQTDVPIAFVFSGNGSQWAGMAVEAYRNNPSFRDRLNVINALFRMRSEIDIVELLFDPDLEAKLRKTSIAQPLLFAVQATLADVLGIEGVRPHAVFGHSVGEIAAAYVAGAISLVDAVSIIAKRSHHQERLAGVGRMIAVQLPPDQARKLCTENGLDDLCVAAVNARNSVTISGPTEQVLALREKLRSARVVAQLLDIDYAFHHPSIETARDGFLAEMAELTLRPTQVPFISAVTGGVLAGNLLTADYWWRNLRDPVLFEQATQAALDVGCRLFVEIGPRPILLNYVKDTIRAAGVPAGSTPTFVKDESVADPVARAHAKIIAHGGAYDRRKAFGARNAAITLPGLPFELLDLRHEFTSDALDLYGRHKVPHTLAGWRVDRTGASWKNHIDSRIYPDLADHVVDGQAILPGSGFLDMALSAARDFYGTDRIELSNFELLRALPLSDTLLEVSTVLSPETGDIRINSRERLSSEDWALHAVARCRVLGDAARGAASAPFEAGARTGDRRAGSLSDRDRVRPQLRPGLPAAGEGSKDQRADDRRRPSAAAGQRQQVHHLRAPPDRHGRGVPWSGGHVRQPQRSDAGRSLHPHQIRHGQAPGSRPHPDARTHRGVSRVSAVDQHRRDAGRCRRPGDRNPGRLPVQAHLGAAAAHARRRRHPSGRGTEEHAAGGEPDHPAEDAPPACDACPGRDTGRRCATDAERGNLSRVPRLRRGSQPAVAGDRGC